MVCKMPFWKYEDPKGGPSWQESHLGYVDTNMGWFVWRYIIKAVSYAVDLE